MLRYTDKSSMCQYHVFDMRSIYIIEYPNKNKNLNVDT
jgi:hypothetical protein